MEGRNREVRFYWISGKFPFKEWFESLPVKTQAVIDKAIDKIRIGLLTEKNSRSLGEGLFEFKVDVGPGYRIYFIQDDLVVRILCGGDKSTQDRDIKRAREYKADYEATKDASE